MVAQASAVYYDNHRGHRHQASLSIANRKLRHVFFLETVTCCCGALTDRNEKLRWCTRVRGGRRRVHDPDLACPSPQLYIYRYRITQRFPKCMRRLLRLRYLTNCELLNAISAGHGWYIHRHFQITQCCTHLISLHSPHLMTCGRNSYPIQPHVVHPDHPKNQEV